MARDLQVSPNLIRATIEGKSAITAESALRLGKYFGISPEIRLDLQTDYHERLRYHPR